MIGLRVSTVAAVCGVLVSAAMAQSSRLVAICPWTFEDGNKTSRSFVIETVRKVVEHQGYIVLPQEKVDQSFESLHPAVAFRKGFPVVEDLSRYARSVEADILVFGKASWHTRSIWVGTGPKTISDASVDLYVFNARSRRITFEKLGSHGRSDEKESALKDVADILITPFVTVVSGGPATPREQRAAQIAVGRAMGEWVRRRGR